MLTKDRIGGMVMLAFCLAYWLVSRNIHVPIFLQQGFHARSMPEILSVLGVVLSLAVIIFPGSDDKPEFAGKRWGIAAAFMVLMSLYGLTIKPLGFLLSTSAFLVCGFLLLGERNPLKLFLAAVPLVVAFWVLMTQGLDIFIDPWPFFLRGGDDA